MKKRTPPGGLEPPTFRLTAERANQLRHGGLDTGARGNKTMMILFQNSTLYKEREFCL